jgi:2-polyprenyl-3-methyl-5-hydroxy-6-metoxy-1,4-benzoquinol methylase
MNTQLLEQADWTELDKIRQQYDNTPYPRVPLDASPTSSYSELYSHSLVTPYYLKHRKVVETEQTLILDAGCGSGYKSLILAVANPGAKIVSVDISESSVELTRQRLRHHGFSNVECHVMMLQDLPKLGLEFNYINCDEVLYLLPNPTQGLQALKSVLKPNGIIRANLHSAFKRASFFRAQTLFKSLGLMDTAPGEVEHEVVRETMKALKSTARLRVETWSPEYEDSELSPSLIATNHLLVGDRGFTIPELFEMLEQSDLEFLSMVDWRKWDVTELFADPDNLPAIWGMSLAYASPAEKLRIFELLHPVHRLLDFWCTHSQVENGQGVDDWSDLDWQNAIVHLHPHLRHDAIKAEVLKSVASGCPVELSQWIKNPALSPVILESTGVACLLPLWQSPQPIKALVERYCKISPVDLITLEPHNPSTAFQQVRQLLNQLDAFLYVLIEQPS